MLGERTMRSLDARSPVRKVLKQSREEIVVSCIWWKRVGSGQILKYVKDKAYDFWPGDLIWREKEKSQE